MGKDNVPFHTLSFPATLMGSGEPWKLVDYIKSFNYLTYDGGQFSTSRGRGVFMDDALEILPADAWRWWLLSHAPETGDSEFTWEGFQTAVNKDLADVLGNFVSRVTKFCRSRFGEAVPGGGEWGPQEDALIAELQARLAAYADHMDAIEVRKSAAELRAIWVAGQRVSAGGRALGGVQGGPRQGRRDHPAVAEPDPALCDPVGTLHPAYGRRAVRRAADGRPGLARRPAQRADRPAAGPRLQRAGQPVRQDHG
jgi:hypothetical protein